MSAKPLAEVYEKLKEVRRQGGGMQLRIEQLRAIYGPAWAGNVDFAELKRELDALAVGQSGQVPNLIKLIRVLEIKTLADRVFGDEAKADAWLQRPNSSLSGQKPADMLKDELGAAVVREALEQIDHGIFA